MFLFVLTFRKLLVVMHFPWLYWLEDLYSEVIHEKRTLYCIDSNTQLFATKMVYLCKSGIPGPSQSLPCLGSIWASSFSHYGHRVGVTARTRKILPQRSHILGGILISSLAGLCWPGIASSELVLLTWSHLLSLTSRGICGLSGISGPIWRDYLLWAF